jgi:hypothetical protein
MDVAAHVEAEELGLLEQLKENNEATFRFSVAKWRVSDGKFLEKETPTRYKERATNEGAALERQPVIREVLNDCERDLLRNSDS